MEDYSRWTEADCKVIEMVMGGWFVFMAIAEVVF